MMTTMENITIDSCTAKLPWIQHGFIQFEDSTWILWTMLISTTLYIVIWLQRDREVNHYHPDNNFNNNNNRDTKNCDNSGSDNFGITKKEEEDEENHVAMSLDVVAALDRKKSFLSSTVGKNYGYVSSPCGHIDTWRHKELPHLKLPLGMGASISSTTKNQNSNGNVDHTGNFQQKVEEQEQEQEIYLDYAGAALPTRSQLLSISESSLQILANPHSTGPAAARTQLLIEQVKKQIMDHFNCHPGKAYGISSADTEENNSNSNNLVEDMHPGYEMIFTSGATESFRKVSELFPWSFSSSCPSCPCHGKKSMLVYSQNSHTSLIGMRGPAQASGGAFLCQPISSIENATDATFLHWAESSGDNNNDDENSRSTTTSSSTNCACANKTSLKHLLAFPLECNFTGDRIDAKSVIQVARASSVSSGGTQHWYTMLDLAKAASTGPVNIRELDPDFACVSFYKLFGEPTGLGALFVKKSAVDVLMKNKSTPSHQQLSHTYFGGGSVDAIISGIDFTIPRSEPSPLNSTVHGTVHFRGIISLLSGFQELRRVGNMDGIRRHTRSLSFEFINRLVALKHSNGEPAVIIYGAWNKVATEFEKGRPPNLNNTKRYQQLPGPTVAFNIVRSDGSFVGYNEVAKLASLNKNPIQLRTGCFCNPGACQNALKLTNDEIRSNYLLSGHICGDEIDIINEKPTGAIRASFGKDSTWEDMDSLVTFMEKLYIQRELFVKSQTTNDKHRPSPNQVQPIHTKISELYIFPIKSCAAQRVKKWKIMESGKFLFDREFALVDASGVAMRLQSYPKMGLLTPYIDIGKMTLTVKAPGCKDLVLKLDSECDSNNCVPGSKVNKKLVKVCGNRCGGEVWGGYDAAEWFSSFLGVQCWLARHTAVPTSNNNPEKTEHGSASSMQRNGEVAFANDEPLLLLSERAVSTLNGVLISQNQRTVNARHFRPNVVVGGFENLKNESTEERNGDFFEGSNPEDNWSLINVRNKGCELEVVGQCARCSMVDVDPTSAMKGKTLRALADYRRRGGQITFGIFLRCRRSLCAANFSGSDLVLEEGDIIQCT